MKWAKSRHKVYLCSPEKGPPLACNVLNFLREENSERNLTDEGVQDV